MRRLCSIITFLFFSLFIHGKTQDHFHQAAKLKKTVSEKKTPLITFSLKTDKTTVSFSKAKRKTRGLIVYVPYVVNKNILLHLSAPPTFKPGFVSQHYSSLLYFTGHKRGPPSF